MVVVVVVVAAVELTFSISRIRISSSLSCLMCVLRLIGALACGLLLLQALAVVWVGVDTNTES